MRLLFELDRKDYAACTHSFTRNSARSIIIRDGKIAMLRSEKTGCYEVPGGGIEAGETPEEAMARETLEEAGLIVIPASVREYGCVHRVQKAPWDETERFIQDNYYYLCEAEAPAVPQKLDRYEAQEGYVLEFVDPSDAIRRNRGAGGGFSEPMVLEREARVLELLISEGFFG